MLWWLAHTTLTAAVLVGIVALVCRLGRFGPAVRHALWLLVLLKLLTPPLVKWHLPWPAGWPDFRTASVSRSPEPDRLARPQLDPHPAAPMGPALPPDAGQTAPPSGSGKASVKAVPPAPVDKGNSESTATSDRAAPFSSGKLNLVVPVVEFLWLGSAGVVAFLTLLRVQRFRRLLVWKQPAPGWLRRLVGELAAKLRVSPPRTLVLPGITTPFLWCLGWPKLLLPAALMEQFSPDCRRGVIAHELAHLRRRDHWVSWLQFLALCFWWWNPLFWYIRRRLRENAELACDAWVVTTLPECRRAYAEALIEVSQLVSAAPAPVPGLGIGGSGRQAFEGRLTMIMGEKMPCRVPARGLLAMGLLALVVLPGWSPGPKADPPQTEDQAPAAKGSEQHRVLEAALKQARVNDKYAMLLRQIKVAEDVDQYTDFNDYGYSQTNSYQGYEDLPAGYWVYVEPYWYVWRDLTAMPMPKRAWGPEQATGAPDTSEAGDLQTAWASLTEDGQDEWLLLEYAEPVIPKEVHVYETYNPGALYRVTAFKLDGTEVEIWKGPDPTPAGSDKGVSKIPVKVDFKTNRIKIYLASKDVPGWNEIDAVGLIDTAGKTQWAVAAEASSTYAQPRPVANKPMSTKRAYGPEQATGAPDTPEAGDFPTAWASLTADGQDEWLELEYAEEVKPTAVLVYETFNPGALYKVSVFQADGTEVEVWKGKDPTPVGSGKGVSVVPIKVNFKTKRVKIYLASKEVPGWNEIDAVGLRDTSQKTHWAVAAKASSTYAQAQAQLIVELDVAMQQELVAAQQRIAQLETENRMLRQAIQELKDKMKSEGDTEFTRRLYLDLLGRLPTKAEVEKFMKDTTPEKRQRLIEELLKMTKDQPPAPIKR
jgi:beta-lactamase regulating signal transducer with metallopeptidase domain